ncbi:hypothetical protein OHA25_31910 [Nonomuraea sp. NBC_00507]
MKADIERIPCPTCDGQGDLAIPLTWDDRGYRTYPVCGRCGGTGEVEASR